MSTFNKRRPPPEPFATGSRVKLLKTVGREDLCGKCGTVYVPPTSDDPTVSVKVDGFDAPMVFPVAMVEAVEDDHLARLKRLFNSSNFSEGEKAALRWAYGMCGAVDNTMFNFIHAASQQPRMLERLRVCFAEEVSGYQSLHQARTSAQASLAVRVNAMGLQVPNINAIRGHIPE